MKDNLEENNQSVDQQPKEIEIRYTQNQINAVLNILNNMEVKGMTNINSMANIFSILNSFIKDKAI